MTLSEKSLTIRITVGKLAGLAIGLFGFFIIPIILTEVSTIIRWGILLWYITFGAVIGSFGAFNRHPILKFPLPWYIRGPIIGAWLNFVLTLFAYDQLAKILFDIFGQNGMFESPFWLVAEGAFFGLVIDYFATRFEVSNKKKRKNKHKFNNRNHKKGQFHNRRLKPTKF